MPASVLVGDRFDATSLARLFSSSPLSSSPSVDT
jgi:hypothetical protein